MRLVNEKVNGQYVMFGVQQRQPVRVDNLLFLSTVPPIPSTRVFPRFETAASLRCGFSDSTSSSLQEREKLEPAPPMSG